MRVSTCAIASDPSTIEGIPGKGGGGGGGRLGGRGPAVGAGSGIPGTWGTATWPDGTKQVTHNGQPLYYYVGDSVAGDATGEGVGGVWVIAPGEPPPGGPR